MESKLTLVAQRLDESIPIIYWLTGDESPDDKSAYLAILRERMGDAVIALLNAAEFIVTSRNNHEL